MEKKYSLPKEFADKWVLALLSNEYSQGIGELTINVDDQKDFSYCCLGVACKVVGISDTNLHPYSSLGQIRATSGEETFKLAGIPEQLIGTELEQVLIDLNDNQDYTFDRIANWIIKNVEFIEPKEA